MSPSPSLPRNKGHSPVPSTKSLSPPSSFKTLSQQLVGPREKGNSRLKLSWQGCGWVLVHTSSSGKPGEAGEERMARPVPAVMQRPTALGGQEQEGGGPFTGVRVQDSEHANSPGRRGKAIQGQHALPSQFNGMSTPGWTRTAESATSMAGSPGTAHYMTDLGAELHSTGHSCSFLETSAQSTVSGTPSEFKKLLV